MQTIWWWASKAGQRPSDSRVFVAVCDHSRRNGQTQTANLTEVIRDQNGKSVIQPELHAGAAQSYGVQSHYSQHCCRGWGCGIRLEREHLRTRYPRRTGGQRTAFTSLDTVLPMPYAGCSLPAIRPICASKCGCSVNQNPTENSEVAGECVPIVDAFRTFASQLTL